MSRKLRLGILFLIFLIAFGLRVYGSWGPFVDESAVILVARRISLRSGSIFLPLYGSEHGPLEVYVERLSSLIFGDNPFGWRFLDVLLGAAIIFPIYGLAREGFGEWAGIFAASFISLNEVYIFLAKNMGGDTIYLFFAAFMLYFFFKALKSEEGKWILAAAAAGAFGFLAKETILFLAPGMLLFLILTKKGRRWFARPSLYLSIVLFFIITSPYLYWTFSHGLRDISPNILKYFRPFNLSGEAFDLFLGYYLPKIPGDIESELGWNYMGPILGLVLILGVFYTMRYMLKAQDEKKEFVKFLHLCFWGVVASSFFLFQGWARHFAGAILPASCLASIAISEVWHWQGQKGRRLFVLVVFGAMLAFSCYATYKFNEYWLVSSTRRLNPLGGRGWADSTTISRGFIKIAREEEATMAVFPRAFEDAGTFFSIYSGIPVMITAVPFRWFPYAEDSQQRIIVFLDTSLRVKDFRKWATENGYRLSGPFVREFHAERRFRGKDEVFNFDVKILIMDKTETALEPDFAAIFKLLWGEVD